VATAAIGCLYLAAMPVAAGLLHEDFRVSVRPGIACDTVIDDQVVKNFLQCEVPHTPFDLPASFIGHPADAEVFLTWRTIMPKPDILDQSATRVELDQRSRDARLRLEYVERLLVVRPPLPKQSLLRRFLRCLGSRTRIGGRSIIAIASAGRASGEREPAESGGGGDTLSAAFPRGWENCPRDARIGPGRRDPALSPGLPVPVAFKAWHHWCGRGDLNSHVLTDNRF
jgi:hypothetical protein